jgi:hypothetical protein
MDGAVTDLQNRWGMLRAFALEKSTDQYKPLASGYLKHTTVGSTTQTDATNFETGNNTIAPLGPVTMHAYTQSFSVSNSDLNSGLRMQDLVTINSANFANKVIEAATAPLTSGNFTVGLISGAASFGFSDLATLQALLKKSPIKNLVLDGSYVARISNSPGFFQKSGVVGGSANAWQAFGWDNISENSDWTGAGANVQGFACHPQAIIGVMGLPLVPNNIPGGILNQQTVTIPGLEISIAVFSWFNPATRTMWTSFDMVAGFLAGDTTAGYLITSA